MLDYWDRAEHLFKDVALKKKKPSDMMDQHKKWVREIMHLKNRIKNPINMKTGKPLSISTVNGFTKRIENIRVELKKYPFIIKWLRICGYWRGYKWKRELTAEQEFIHWFLDRYISKEKWENCLEKDLDHYKKDRDYWRDEVFKQLGDTRETVSRVLNVSEEPDIPKKKRIKRQHSFQVIDGGAVRDQPPFPDP